MIKKLVILEDNPLEVASFMKEVHDKYHIGITLLFFAPAGSDHNELIAQTWDRYGSSFDKDIERVRILERYTLKQKLAEYYDRGDVLLLDYQTGESSRDARDTEEPYPIQFAKDRAGGVFLYAKYRDVWLMKVEDEPPEYYIESDGRYRGTGVLILNYENNRNFVKALASLTPKLDT
jgi:hypothetical protein